MALEGSLRDFGLADILQLLYFQKKTGTLTISGPMDRVTLYFLEGNIVSAESKKRAEENRFGRILIKRGVIKERDLHEALFEQKKTGMRVGDILAKKGLVSEELIRETIISQLTETVIQLFSWKEGNYEFRAQQVSINNKEIPISLDTQHLLMEGLRILDEWSLIEGRLTLDTVFKKTGREDHTITEEESNILSFVDGENDVSMIIDLTQMDNFEVSKALLSLMDRGIIEPVSVKPVITEPGIITPAKKKDLSLFIPLAAFAIALMVALVMSLAKNPLGGDFILSLFERSKREKVERDLERLRFHADLQRLTTGSYPEKVNNILSGKDAWGNAYYYEVKGDNLIIISPGPDRKIGTADDVY